MPYQTAGCRTYVYAIREKRGRLQDRRNDVYVWIGMSCLRRKGSYLDYFTDEVSDSDSINHNEVSTYINDSDSDFYVSFIERFNYNPVTSRPKIVNLQNLHDVLIGYP